ncbi:hypothetical protein BDZ90DRAFT_232850 [Jaminaea rosea]|uniref:Eukaryotic translation initiation factor 3 subunit C n=1 Tax=Jaminaea rosea TaxID=1569628 RepID=A0A316US79_9BASI|nr:hypothetical protein BDZ90DRAFT_232850 [Jaminaea rosea]PWN26733.1 hypothetical protein BDZ90DRAFT_232850 [Jaminaea rosea]
MSSRFFRSTSDSESSESGSSSDEEVMSDSDEEQQKKSQDKKKSTDKPAASSGSASASKAAPAAGGAAKKSRFLKSADSDSSESSSEEEEDMSDSDDSDDDDDDDDDDSDDSDAPAKKTAAKGGAAPAKMSRFMRGGDDSDSDSDDGERRTVIRSAKDKRMDEVDAVVKTIENAQRIDDWVAISKEFDGLLRLHDRQKTMTESVPVSFYRCLSGLETFLNESVAAGKGKKMKAPNAKAMNGMKSKLKKANKDHEEALQRYNKDPEAFEAEFVAANAPVKAAPPAPKAASSAAPTSTAAAGGEQEDDAFQTVGKGGRALAITSEGLFKSLAAVMEARGRKSTDRSEQVAILSKLLGVAESTYQRLRVLLALIAARFDYNSSANAYMPLEMWNAARTEVDQLIATLVADPSYVVKEETEDYDDSIDRVPNQEGEGPVVAVRGSIISFVDRLDDEFTKHLQNLDPHSTEYLERLRDERLLYATIVRAQTYLEQAVRISAATAQDALARVIMRRLEHVYSKQSIIIQALEQASAASQKEDAEKLAQVSSFPMGSAVSSSSTGPAQLVRSLCVHLYKAPGLAGERSRTRAMLCHIYNTALHADYYVARDMLLMSHLQDSISLADAATQILYNRVVVQIGLAAFRVGLVKEAHAALSDIFATGRVKELLAQGVQRPSAYASLSPEQEKLDRQRQLPFHLHINLELLESAYLVCSMLLEVPHMARAGSDPDQRRRVLSRPFRRMLDYTDRQVFSGPPESARDHIMQATKALQVGEWREAVRLVSEIKIWKLLSSVETPAAAGSSAAPSSRGGEESVKALLARRIQEEGLRTYLFSYNAYYSSVSLQHLASTFDLPLGAVRSIVSRMIWLEEIAASLDSGAGGQPVVVLHRSEASRVHQLAQTLAERASSMLEQNERLLDAKLGDGPGGQAGAAGAGGAGRDREGGAQRGGEERRREGRRGGRGGRGGGGRGRGRTQFQALPGQVATGRA